MYLVTDLQNAKIKMERTKEQVGKFKTISGYFNISFLVTDRIHRKQ